MKIRALIICLLMALSIARPAFAQISANTDAQSDSIIVSGTVMHDETQVVLIKPGFDVADAENAAVSADKSELGKVIEYFRQVTAKGKNIEMLIPMRDDAEKGKYLLVVDNEVYSVYFATLEERVENMIPAAKTALLNGSFAQFAGNDGKYFCNSNLYDSLSEGHKVAKYAAEILDEFKNSADLEFMSKISSAMNMGIVMEALNENKINDSAAIKSMTDSVGMIVPSDKIDLINPDKVNKVVADISGRNFVSADEYTKLLSESIFVNVINNASDMSNADKKVFFETYAKQLGLNLTAYDKLSVNKKTEVVAKLAADDTDSFAQLQVSLNEFCADATVKVNNGSGSDGGGGGGSSSGGGSSIRAVQTNTEAVNDKNAPNAVESTSVGFTDLSECKWAQPAIEYLVSSKMINGYEDNTFRPLKNITRAEFISIIAREYLPADNYTQSFSDVKSDSWYFNYVESAYSNGIIYGTENNVFSPDENISRQDISVILCRLAEFSGNNISGESTEFVDDSDISDYAKEAVYNLKTAGIVNGDENGKFNPGNAATRAEAVQMIYNFIKFLE